MLRRQLIPANSAQPYPAWAVEVRFTEAGDGDFAIDGGAAPETLAARRQRVHPAQWVWMRHVHGDSVLRVVSAGEHAGAAADAAVTRSTDVPLAVQTADCAPLVLVDNAGGLGVVHAGWRGVENGVIPRAIEALVELSRPESAVETDREHSAAAHRVQALVGPCIGAECYEFSEADLTRLVDMLGPSVAAQTTAGRPALDMRAAVTAQLRSAGVAQEDIEIVDHCTACSPSLFSHRARADRGRQATVAWMVPLPTSSDSGRQ